MFQVLLTGTRETAVAEKPHATLPGFSTVILSVHQLAIYIKGEIGTREYMSEQDVIMTSFCREPVSPRN